MQSRKSKQLWQKRHVIVAEESGEIVAYSLNFIKENVKVYAVKEIGYVSDLYVKANYRGQGIAGKFKNLAFAWFRKKKRRFASIAVHSGNKKAHEIYQS